MLRLVIPKREYFNDNTQEFVDCPETVLQLEHSLLSISKWESKWKKPYLGQGNGPKTYEESVDYIRCMTINTQTDPRAYIGLGQDVFDRVRNYIEDSMTATWFNDKNQKKPGRIQTVTSELIYYWMVSYRIPFSCEKWHLNRLLTLIHICDVKNAPDKKMKRNDIYARNRALNAARRKQHGSKG